jgi:hypothetical protein
MHGAQEKAESIAAQSNPLIEFIRRTIARASPRAAKPSRAGGLCYFGGAGVNASRLLGSGFGFGLGAFLVSFLPLSLFPMPPSVTQSRCGEKRGFSS